MPPKRKATTSATQDPLHLQPGSQVEISSNDPGFRGSWFTGTVLKRTPSRNPDKFLVQYTHIFQDEAGTKPLKENINAVDLRPLAPRETSRKFKFGEEVDAFNDDGWWEGVITKELENGKFHVYFKSSKEQLEFGENQLRLHREWVNGSWKPPLEEKTQTEKEVKSSKGQNEEKMSNKTRTENSFESDKAVAEGKVESNKAFIQEKLECDNNAASKEKLESDKAGTGEKLESGKITKEGSFSEGEDVEVCSDDDGFKGAWFSATIVKAVGKGRYLIQYKSLRTEDDTDFLKEEIDTLHIRPCPPEIFVADQFKKCDEVDALYNDGWWVGVVSSVLSDSKYQVYFRTSKEELMFNHSELRLHQDWIDAKWIAASQVCHYTLEHFGRYMCFSMVLHGGLVVK
ncbi:hypothetical protein PTKIN_Ptkin01aG0305000 [Pterospermum kingtungense]